MTIKSEVSIFPNYSSHYYLPIWCFSFHAHLCVHGALYVTSFCCSNQCVLSGYFRAPDAGPAFQKINNTFVFHLKLFLFISANPFPVRGKWDDFSLHFLSCHITSLSGQLSLHLLMSQFLIYADLSWIFQSYLQVQHHYFNSYINWTQIKCLSWACASSQRSPSPNSRSPLSLHCFPFTLALLSCSYWAKEVCLMPTVVRRKHKAKILIFSHTGAHRDDTARIAALEI